MFAYSEDAALFDNAKQLIGFVGGLAHALDECRHHSDPHCYAVTLQLPA